MSYRFRFQRRGLVQQRVDALTSLHGLQHLVDVLLQGTLPRLLRIMSATSFRRPQRRRRALGSQSLLSFTWTCCGVLQVSLHLLDTASPFAVVLHDEITQHPEHVASDRDDLSITPRELHFTIAAAGQRLHSSEATLETRKASKVRRKSLRKSKTLALKHIETH